MKVTITKLKLPMIYSIIPETMSLVYCTYAPPSIHEFLLTRIKDILSLSEYEFPQKITEELETEVNSGPDISLRILNFKEEQGKNTLKLCVYLVKTPEQYHALNPDRFWSLTRDQMMKLNFRRMNNSKKYKTLKTKLLEEEI